MISPLFKSPSLLGMTLVLLSALSVVAPCRAQDFFRQRNWTQCGLCLDVLEEEPSVRTRTATLLFRPKQGPVNAHVEAFLEGQTQGCCQIDLPVDWIGSVQEVGLGLFLVSGTRFPQGYPGAKEGIFVLLRVQKNAAPPLLLTIEDSEAVPGIDPVWIDYNPNESAVYAGDFGTGIFLRAPWNGAAPLPASGTFLPLLPDPQFSQLIPNRPGWVVAIRETPCGGHEHGRYTPYFGTSDGTKLWDTLGGGYWDLATVAGGTALAANEDVDPEPHLSIVDQGFIGGVAPLVIRTRNGSGQISFQVLDATDNTVLSTEEFAGNETRAVGPFQRFNDLPGRDYMLKSLVPEVLNFRFAAHVRYGAPVGTTSFSFGKGILPVWGKMDAGVHNVGALTSCNSCPAANAACALHINVREFTPEGYTDPVVNGVLQPAAAVAFTVNLAEQRGCVSHKLQIPDDPSLSGSVILFQYVGLTPTGTITYSDVFGTEIDNAEPQALMVGVSSAQKNLAEATFLSQFEQPNAVLVRKANAKARELRGK